MTQRRLVICFDGTWNRPDRGETSTNVVKLLRAIPSIADDGVSQISFYDKGVGTAGPLDRMTGGAFGRGLTENMVDGYRFLGNNYLPGDELYIFGFSRGAFTARSLAGFIATAGLFGPLHLGQGLADALEIYRRPGLSPAQKTAAIDALKLWRQKPVPVTCLGVWDTVGSLGIPGDLGRQFLRRLYFHDVQLSADVAVALHAVAIDEKRSAFAPTLWVRGAGDPGPSGQQVEQVWFAGVHSNVGGSYEDCGLSDITLNWMIQRVRRYTALQFDPAYLAAHVAVDPGRNALARGVESRSLLYFGSRFYPYQRLIAQNLPRGSRLGDWFRRTFRALDRRNIPPAGLRPVNEMVHVSALERWGERVLHDAPARQGGRAVPYRPNTLEAARARLLADGSIPVVGWDGEPLPSDAPPGAAAPPAAASPAPSQG